MTVRTLIVDDSATMRAILRGMLEHDPEIQVVGAARDAMEARAMIKELNPDVVTLDLEMPGMSGLDFLSKIMSLRPMPVVIVSSLTSKGAETTMRALQMGAFDCVGKPEMKLHEDGSEAMLELCAIVKAAARSNSKAHHQPAARPVSAPVTRTSFNSTAGGAELVAIGASTGGVEALCMIMSAWPENCPPTFVVQHISGAFSDALTRRLDSMCAANVVIAETDTIARPGHVYLAPGNVRHLVVARQSGLICKLRDAPLISGHRPSVDALFSSVAQCAGGRAVGVLLTGMGQDGAQGLLQMHQSGCRTIAQDKETSVVHGMPRAAIELGAADHVLPLNKIAEKALSLCSQ